MKLSPTMRRTLERIAHAGPAWCYKPAPWGTLEALERRGLIEVRLAPTQVSVFGYEARLTDAGREALS